GGDTDPAPRQRLSTSKDQFHSKLDHTRGICLRRYLSKRCRVIEVSRRITEDHPVEEVEELRPELQIPRLALQIEFFEDREVFRIGGRPADAGNAWGRIAKGERTWLAEGVDVEVHILGGVETAHGYRTPNVGGYPVGAVAASKQRNISAAGHCYGGPGL